MARDTTSEELLVQNPDLSARDMRDLLMEYDVDGITASNLTADRLARETS